MIPLLAAIVLSANPLFVAHQALERAARGVAWCHGYTEQVPRHFDEEGRCADASIWDEHPEAPAVCIVLQRHQLQGSLAGAFLEETDGQATWQDAAGRACQVSLHQVRTDEDVTLEVTAPIACR